MQIYAAVAHPACAQRFAEDHAGLHQHIVGLAHTARGVAQAHQRVAPHFALDAVGNVDALHQDAGHGAVAIAHRLVDEIDMALGGGAVRRRRHQVAGAVGGIRFAAAVHLVEQRDEALVHRFGQALRHGQAQHIALADQLQVAGIDEREAVRGTVEHGHEHRGLLEQFGH
ncbi:hypothetical protein DUPY_36350 [Duganella phyllosphaerae]|uniref:Uncharacterized protein n=1 Tax=Duganella phyllosphaerae TaxID=762836 RepID=A0A1E7WFV7_9BURK|nr:hypothetical protein DUPY_36350 [Duganella phyllosphaerae]